LNCQRCCYSPKKYATQEQLNKAFHPKSFTLAWRYSTVMNVMFIALFYAPGMPVFYAFACCTCTLMYWGEIYAFLRLFTIPAHYDDQMQATFVSFIPWAVFLHNCSAFFFYTSSGTESYFLDEYVNCTFSPGADVDYEIGDRMNQGNGFFALCCALIFASWKLLLLFFAMCPCKCCEKGALAYDKKMLKQYE
jgi:hypothetical protein